jgi:serine/threonine protein kinase/Flp pilus assembly protein TadD
MPDDRFESALAEMLLAEERGETLDLSRVLQTAPELETRLREFFRNRDGFDRLAPQLAPTATHRAAPPPELPPGSQLGEYAVVEEVGRGGRGIVYRVRDPELNRALAIKVLRPELRDEPDAVRRFLEEAQVMSQLQHPGIVPVHAVGQLPDGRPYFAMKLVQGRTLAALLAERPVPADDLPHFLGIFQQVCQAMAYAHSRGVIHRDLKPSNIMVGAFAEVQVMDWGLAKVLAADMAGQAHAPGEPEPVTAGAADTIRTVRTEGTGLSSADGLVVGTVAYMAPEQADGQVEQLDPRTDVFGLGALLCEILTGLPPYAGAPAWKLHLLAAAGNLADALGRLERCGADAELIALAKDCLAPERQRRPPDAGAVAQRLAMYLAAVQERLRQAELEKAAAQARAEESHATVRAERRARRLTAGLAAAVLLLLGVGGGTAWWLQQQEQTRAADAALHRQRTDSEVTVAMSDARLLREQAMGTPLGDGGRFREALAAAQKAFVLAETGEASAPLRHQAANLVADLGREKAAAERDRRLVARLWEVGGPQELRLSTGEQGETLQLAKLNSDEQFALAFRDWGLDVHATPTREAAARLLARPAAVVTEVVAALDAWAIYRGLGTKSEAGWQQLADLAAALDDPADSRRRELRALLARKRLPAERALGELSRAFLPLTALSGVVPGEDRKRLRALAAQTKTATEPALGLAILTRALWVAGDEVLAEKLLRDAIRVRPGEVLLHQALGPLLQLQHPPRWHEAVECYVAARALRPQLGTSLANAYLKAGRVDDGLALWKDLVDQDPRNPWMHFQRGRALSYLRRHTEAAAEYRSAIALKSDFADAHFNLGVSLYFTGQYAEAAASCREAIRWEPGNKKTHVNLGVALLKQARPKEAEAQFRKAVRLDEHDPVSYSNLAKSLFDQGRYLESEKACDKAIRLKPDFAGAYVNLGNALQQQRRFDEAEAAFRQAIHLKPDHPGVRHDLGAALLDQGRHEEAEAVFRDAIRLTPEDFRAYSSLAIALAGLRRYQEAETACRDALDRKPDDDKTLNNLGNILKHLGRYQEAAAFCRRAIKIKPDEHKTHYVLGIALLGTGRFRDAQTAFADVVRLAPPGDPLSQSAVAYMRHCEHLLMLANRLPAIRSGKEKPAGAAEARELGWICLVTGDYALGVRLYAAAFAAAPDPTNHIHLGHRYGAACCAVLAAAALKADDRERPRLRRQALDWLRADLAFWEHQAEARDTGSRARMQQALWTWQNHPELASVRPKEGLATLPDAERSAWEKLWADVEALRKGLREAK